MTDQPPANQRNCSWASSVAFSSSGPQQIGICPTARPSAPMRFAPVTPFQVVISSAFGSTATRWSASGAKVSTERSPETATPMSTPCSGTSQMRAESTW